MSLKTQWARDWAKQYLALADGCIDLRAHEVSAIRMFTEELVKEADRIDTQDRAQTEVTAETMQRGLPSLPLEVVDNISAPYNRKEELRAFLEHNLSEQEKYPSMAGFINVDGLAKDWMKVQEEAGNQYEVVLERIRMANKATTIATVLNGVYKGMRIHAVRIKYSAAENDPHYEIEAFLLKEKTS